MVRKYKLICTSIVAFSLYAVATSAFTGNNNNLTKIDTIYTPPAITQDYAETVASQRMLLHIRDAQRMVAENNMERAEAHLYYAITAAASLSSSPNKVIPIHRISIFSVQDEEGKLTPVLYVSEASLTQPMAAKQVVSGSMGSITHAEIKYLAGKWHKSDLMPLLASLQHKAENGSLKLHHFQPLFAALYTSEITRIPSRQKAQDHLALARLLMVNHAHVPAETALADARKYIQAMTQTPNTVVVSKDALRELMGEIQTFEKNKLSEGETMDLQMAEWMQKLS